MHIDIEEHYDKVYRYCYFKLKNQQKAEDITQETFLRCLEQDGYTEAGRPLAYLYTIARNLCTDEFRRKQTEHFEEELAKEGLGKYNPGQESLVHQGFEQQVIQSMDLRNAMESLAEEEQELLLLRFVNEVSFATLEKMYGRSRFALRREIHKITNKLERRISNGP